VGYFVALLAGTFALLYASDWFDARQLASICIFSTFIFGTLLFGECRLAFAFGGIALLLALNLLDIPRFVESANLKVIMFLVGMFLVIGYLEENQFFERIVAGIVKAVGPRPKMLLLTLMVMGSVSAALVDEVTSILFMTGTMLHLTNKYRLNPVPFIIMLVFATNIGSAASSIGNPIGVMIAMNAGFSFLEFLRWSAPVALVVNVVTYVICRWWYADAFEAFAKAVEAEHAAVAARRAAMVASSPRRALVGAGGGDNGAMLPEEENAHGPIDDHSHGEHEFNADAHPWLSWLIFLMTILLLVTHGLTEKLLGLREGTMMLGAALTMGCVVLLLRREKARELVERRVDWWTLSFFMMLFASVGTLEHMQVTKVIATKLMHATGDNQQLLIWIVGWSTGWLSAFLDNVLAVATFMPVITDVRLAAAPKAFPEAVYWAMLFGGTFMGNMTVIGSTANIIAVGVLEKRGHGTIRFLQWFKIGLIVSVVSMLVAMTMLWTQNRYVNNPMMVPPKSQGVVVHH
jgi:Na+/H+ antiporter NhaD/arsenite permease-like protein